MNLKKGFLETPFDVINLPSMGVFYSNKISTLAIKYLTAKEEIVLTSPSLYENNQAIDLIIKESILNKDFNYEEMLLCDKRAVMVFLRSTTYGDKVELNINCPKCSFEGNANFQLSSLELKDDFEIPDELGEYELVLPKMKLKEEKVVVKLKPITIKNFNENEKNKSVLHSIIKSVNGISETKFINNVIKTMPISDSAKIKSFMENSEPGFEKKISLTCPSCDHEFKEEFSVGNELLRFPPEHRKNVMEEVFLGYYYGKGLKRSDVYKMSTFERRWTIQRISEEIEKKNKAEKDAMEKAKRSSVKK